MFKKIYLSLCLCLAGCGLAAAQAPHHDGSVAPQTSTADDPTWYLMMSSHNDAKDRQYRFLRWNGSQLVTEQYTSGMTSDQITDQYLWQLLQAGDGNASHVYIVNKATGTRINVPSTATPSNNTQLVMASSGAIWNLQLCSATGLSGSCADTQYCLDYVAYSGNAFLNAQDSSHNYGVTIYSAGVQNASGWFFYQADGTSTGGSTGGGSLDVPEALPNDYVADNPFETMIRLGRMTPEAPLYTMPSGSGGSAYITQAITNGDAVVYPLSYVRSSTPTKHFMVISKETSLVMRGSAFNLVFTENVQPSTHYITAYTDWNRDGVYEAVSSGATVDASTGQVTVAFSIPDDAQLGKTRIRVRLDLSRPASADAAVSVGRTYDFVIYVMPKAEAQPTDVSIAVGVNDPELGSAYIVTEANAQGRYDIGSQVTVRAVPAVIEDGEVEFQEWQEDGVAVSTDAEYTFFVDGSRYLTAFFLKKSSGISAVLDSTPVKGTLSRGNVKLHGLEVGAHITLFTLSGQSLAEFTARQPDVEYTTNYPDRIIFALVDDGESKTVLKLMEK